MFDCSVFGIYFLHVLLSKVKQWNGQWYSFTHDCYIIIWITPSSVAMNGHVKQRGNLWAYRIPLKSAYFAHHHHGKSIQHVQLGCNPRNVEKGETWCGAQDSHSDFYNCCISTYFPSPMECKSHMRLFLMGAYYWVWAYFSRNPVLWDTYFHRHFFIIPHFLFSSLYKR